MSLAKRWLCWYLQAAYLILKVDIMAERNVKICDYEK